MAVAVEADPYIPAYIPPYTAGMAKRPLISAQQARENFSKVLDSVSDDNHPAVIRRSSIKGVFVPPGWYKRAAELMGDPWDDWSPPPADD